MSWCLLAEVDETEVLAPMKKLASLFIIIFFLIPLAAWPAGRFVARIITKPLRKLHVGTEVIGAGNLDYKVGTDAKDEIGQLSRAFDEMTEHLKETTTSIDYLNKEIGERKRAEYTLRESEERYRQIIESASDIIYRTDEKGYFTFVNPVAARTVGYSHDEVMGKHYLELIHPDYRDEAAKVYGSQVAKKINNTYYEYPVVRKDGTERWLGQNAQLIMEDGRITGIQAVARDITDRKKIEEALQKSEEIFRTITATANDSVIMMDSEGKVTYWNEAAEKTFGYTSEEILGKNLHATFVPERFLEAHKKGFPSFKKTGQGAAIGKTLELAALRKDGAEVPVELSLSSVKIGGAWNAVGLIRDITARKKAEEALQKAKDEAEDANLAKTEFLASMSHEIRTPMNAIIGMADLLQETTLDPEQLQYVQTFQSAGENLLNIINDILDISKVEAGRVQLETTGFDLNEMIENICEVMAIRAHEKGLELTCNIMPDVPTSLLGDPVRLRQILINLMGNAIKFTGKGEVAVQVERQKSGGRDPGPGVGGQGAGDGQVELVFSVTDTGIGIPLEKIDTIFEVFSQADSSTTRKYGGTGLGLSISKKLVELMDGDIRVDSKPGHGSTFSFTVRFKVQRILSEKTESLPLDLKGFRVLVVDDNATNRLILSKVLSGLGAVVTEAQNGDRGLAELKRALETAEPFQLALIDGRMPEMDGFELAGRIKETAGKIRDTSIMMLTSDNRRDDIARCRKLGISTYLVKPVKRSALLDAIAVTLGRKTAPPVERVRDFNPVDSSKVRPLNILLVEDSKDNRLLIQAYFKKTSDNIEIAENGEIAVEKFKSGKYDIVLMDVQMPVMDGYTATGEIRKWEKNKGGSETPIIALTAHAMTEDFQKSIDAGCTDHLTKPIKKAILMETIQKHARRNHVEVQR
jgi:PAS domain S-box-containing protein